MVGNEVVEFLISVTEVKEYECPGPEPSGLGGPFPLCDGATPGELRSGYLTARRASEGAVLSQEGYREVLRQRITARDPAASDEYGPGEWRLYSLGCLEPQADDASSCGERYTVVLSAIVDGGDGHRELLIFFVEGTESPVVTSTWTGILLGDDDARIILQDGGFTTDLGTIVLVLEGGLEPPPLAGPPPPIGDGARFSGTVGETVVSGGSYAIDVASDFEEPCGKPGDTVVFLLGAGGDPDGQAFDQAGIWDNTTTNELDLTLTPSQ
jgi:hypothetical protein